MNDDLLFLLWSGRRQMWWCPNDGGYTPNMDEAGRYTEAEAFKRVARSALCGDLAQVTSMLAAPDNWTEPPPTPLRVVAGPGPLRDVLPEALERLTRGWPREEVNGS